MSGVEIIVEINKRAAPNKRPAWNSGQKQLIRNTHTLWQDVKKLSRRRDHKTSIMGFQRVKKKSLHCKRFEIIQGDR